MFYTEMTYQIQPGVQPQGFCGIDPDQGDMQITPGMK